MNKSLEGVPTEPSSGQSNMFQQVEAQEDLSLYEPISSESVELVNLWEESIPSNNIESNEVILEEKNGK